LLILSNQHSLSYRKTYLMIWSFNFTNCWSFKAHYPIIILCLMKYWVYHVCVYVNFSIERFRRVKFVLRLLSLFNFLFNIVIEPKIPVILISATKVCIHIYEHERKKNIKKITVNVLRKIIKQFFFFQFFSLKENLSITNWIWVIINLCMYKYYAWYIINNFFIFSFFFPVLLFQCSKNVLYALR